MGLVKIPDKVSKGISLRLWILVYICKVRFKYYSIHKKQMKNTIIVLILLAIAGCCRNKNNDVQKLQDKSWFPYKTDSSLIYQNHSGAIDSLKFTAFDTLNFQNGEWGCSWEWEQRKCVLQSTKYTDFAIEVHLSPEALYFEVSHSGKYTGLFYEAATDKITGDSTELRLVDSLLLNNKMYRNLLILTDTTNDFKIYYNRTGIPRYIIHKDTFDLKK